MLEATYVIPLKWQDTRVTAEMTSYLEWLSQRIHVIVVDGSPVEIFERHAELWSPLAKHVRPDPDLSFANGKVDGVTTGIRAAGTDKVIIADDDIRFSEEALARVVRLLDEHELVYTHDYYAPTPWQARWETARLLINRAFGVSYPVAFGLSRSLFLAMGGYDGNVMFENLELIRSMRFAGARIARAPDLFVLHLPPDKTWFWSQRVRQAYDDFTVLPRMAIWLALGPLVGVALARKRVRMLALAAAAAIGVAEAGRRRAGGRQVFPAVAPLFAPLWLLERAVSSWVAVWQRIAKGGVVYRDRVIERAATPPSELKARIEQRLARRDPVR